MEKITFRLAQESDLPAIVDIYNQSIPAGLATADTEPVSVASRKDWYATHQQANRPLWIIQEDGETVGWISFTDFYGRPAYRNTVELSLYLAEAAQGKGYGKRALKFAIGEAQRLDLKTLLGFIFAHNTPSLNLFQSFGFEEWAHLPHIAEMPSGVKSLKILGRRVIPIIGQED